MEGPGAASIGFAFHLHQTSIPVCYLVSRQTGNRPKLPYQTGDYDEH